MERRRRFVLFSAAILLVAALYFKGHRSPREGGSVAFLASPPTEITVRIKGLVKTPGVYCLPEGSTIEDVILLTGPTSIAGAEEKRFFERRLADGDIVTLAGNSEQHLVVDVEKMKAREAMVLGILLEPDRLEVDDWECVPGIGPKLAATIMSYRQNYGDFHTIEAIQMVPGVGREKYSRLSKYFQQDKEPISQVKR